MNKLESAVIVKSRHGVSAYVHFKDNKDSFIISANNKKSIYPKIEKRIMKVLSRD